MSHKAFLLGYDIGSSSVKVALVDAETNQPIAVMQSPDNAMPIEVPHPGWAEQDPEMWWSHVCLATKALLQKNDTAPSQIRAIGIAYQMHGLVCVNKEQRPIRPAIIWCDSRAVEIGEKAFDEIGHEKCLTRLLNSPGNFTASKLKWVKDHEPAAYDEIDKILLPGDYIAMRLTGVTRTTPQGLSEGILWDYVEERPAGFVLDHYQVDAGLLPEVVQSISLQGYVTKAAAEESGLAVGIPVTYRAGDQPNNALALGILKPGQIAASGGTSGVVYGITDSLIYDQHQRLNSFMHVNSREEKRIGLLLCINGAGILYQWMRQQVAGGRETYAQMEAEAASIEPGSEGLRIIPFGNGVERMLNNELVDAHILHLDFNRHQRSHLYRAALEGIAYAFTRGIQVMKSLGLTVDVIRAGNDNLFQSTVFADTISTLTGSRIDVMDTTGAIGAARVAGVGAGLFSSLDEVFDHLPLVRMHEPDRDKERYELSFHQWEKDLALLHEEH